MSTIESVSSKDEILSYLLKHGQGTAQELAKDLEISPQAIRRHLKDLQEEGLIVYQSVVLKTGRPQHIYQLSQKGRDRFPNQYSQFLVSLLDTIVHTLGYEQASSVLQQYWERKSQEYSQSIGEGSLQERVGKLVELRRQEGYMAEYHALDDQNKEFILTEHNCAISQVASSFPHVCGHELEMFTNALTGCQVERTHWLINGEHRCGYLIKETSFKEDQKLTNVPQEDQALELVINISSNF